MNAHLISVVSYYNFSIVQLKRRRSAKTEVSTSVQIYKYLSEIG